MRKHNQKAFTIVELVIVIAVIAILAAVLIPTFARVIEKARESKDTQESRNRTLNEVISEIINPSQGGNASGNPVSPPVTTGVQVSLKSGSAFSASLNSIKNLFTSIVFDTKNNQPAAVSEGTLHSGLVSEEESIGAYTHSGTLYILSNDTIMAPADASYMFGELDQVVSITFNNFNTANITNMKRMFSGCTGLASIDLSRFSEVTIADSGALSSNGKMTFLFYRCSSLKVIDLSPLNTESVKFTNSMFEGCTNLEHIYVGAGFSVAGVTSSLDMFKNCVKLPNYDGSIVDKTNANTGAGGYLEEN